MLVVFVMTMTGFMLVSRVPQMLAKLPVALDVLALLFRLLVQE
jgi:hypothetical protein